MNDPATQGYVDFMRKADDERQARLAQLGLRVVEILKERGPIFMQAVIRSDKDAQSALGRIYGASLDLGLLPTQPGEERK